MISGNKKEYPLEAFIISIVISLFIFITIPLLNRVTLPKKKYNIRKFNTAVLKSSKRKPPPKIKKKETEKKDKPKIKQQTKMFKALRIDTNLELDYSADASDIVLGFDVLPDLKKDDFIFELDQVDNPPVPIRQFSPIYPVNAKLKGIEGFVSLLFVVTEMGEVINVRITDSKPSEIFNNAAKRAVEKWQFKPATKNGEAVSVNVTITLQFKLD